MIITDLLGTNVILNDEVGKIRAVYGEGRDIRFCILFESGKFSYGVSPHDVVLNEERVKFSYGVSPHDSTS